MLDLSQFITQYGPIFGLIIYVLLKEVWPWMRDKVYPERAERRKDEAAALGDALAQQRIAATQREDRLFGILERTMGTLTRIEGTMDGMQDALRLLTNELERHAEVLHNVNLDISGLYWKAGEARPSRNEKERGT